MRNGARRFVRIRVPVAMLLLALMTQPAQAPNAQVAAGLGRDVTGTVNNAGTTPLALIAPNIDYGDRLNQLDIRIGKLLKAGRTRSVVSLDLFNALNANPVASESSSFSNWQTPLAVLPARLVKVALQFDF